MMASKGDDATSASSDETRYGLRRRLFLFDVRKGDEQERSAIYNVLRCKRRTTNVFIVQGRVRVGLVDRERFRRGVRGKRGARERAVQRWVDVPTRVRRDEATSKWLSAPGTNHRLLSS